jgi:ATP-dependent Lon protease
MPASRWNSSILEMLNWLYEEQAGLEKMIAHPIVTRVVQNEPGSEAESPSPLAEDEQIPNILPILPLRGLVVFPQTAVPLTIGQARSIRLIDDVMASDVRMIALVTSRDPDLETPEPEDLFQVGTVAMVHRMFRAPDGTIRLVVQGLVRCRVLNFIQKEPYLKAEIEAAPETVEEGLELEAMARNARNQFEHIADMVPSIPRELVSSVMSIEDPLQTVYTIANFQRMDLDEAQKLLELDSTSVKLHTLVGLLARESEVLEMGQKIQNEARSEID